MRELCISHIHVNPMKVSGKGVLAIASITLNSALVLDGIQLYRTTEGIKLKLPQHDKWPFFSFGSDLFKRSLLHQIWQHYHTQVLESM